MKEPDCNSKPEEKSGRGRRFWLHELLAIGLCVAAGVLLSTLPHLLAWVRTGDSVYISDYDNLDLHLAIAAPAYHYHPTRLTDRVDDASPTIFSPLQYLPAVWVARVAEAGPMAVNLLWRLWAGITIPLGFYFLFRRHQTRAWIAAGLTLLVVSDSGQIFASPILKNLTYTYQLLSGHGEKLVAGYPMLTTQWRLITPGLSLVYLLAFVLALDCALTRPTRARIGIAGVAFGLLFWVYFYFWTSAALALALAFLILPARRLALVGVVIVGGALGFPALLANQGIKSATGPDWLVRLGFFVPIGHFQQIQIPKVMVVLMALAVYWVIRRRRDLLHWLALIAAPMLLLNHQVVTGLAIQNHHYKYAAGPLLLVLLGILAGQALERRGLTPLRWALFTGVVAFQLASACYLRAVEGTRNLLSLDIAKHYETYRSERLGPASQALPRGGLAAGPVPFATFAAIFEGQLALYDYGISSSPWVTDTNLDRRYALNEYLRGTSVEEFVRKAGLMFAQDPHHQAFAPRLTTDQVRRRVALVRDYFGAIASNPDPWLDEFDVRHVILPVPGPRPLCLRDGWRLVHQGSALEIWCRVPPASPSNPAPTPVLVPAAVPAPKA